MAKLIILTAGMTGRSLELGASPVTIGRTEDNAFQISEPSISTHHCEIFWRGNEAVVKDLGSTNGTYIAGAKITEGSLKPGQNLRLGDVELKLETGSPAFLSRPRTRQILWAGATIAVLLLIAYVATSLISYLQNPPGQIGWWKFDDRGGAVARDSSRVSMGNNGKLVRAPRWVKGKIGGALQFNGVQYVALGKIFQDSYDNISIACWIRHPTSGWQAIVERSVWDNSDGIGLWTDYSGKAATFGHYGDACVRSLTTVQDDRWHQLVGTMAKSGDGYLYSIYVDGRLDNTTTNATGLTATSNGWAIGARYDGSWGYRGLIDDVRIFNRALTPSEIRRLYQP